MSKRCPTPCVCGEIVELDEMRSIQTTLPDGGNLVCRECYCDTCDGSGECNECGGMGSCDHCGATCKECGGAMTCNDCRGLGYGISK